MKVNILLNNPAEIRSGFLNIDPFAPDGDKDRVKCDPAALGPLVDAAEASEVVALGIIDYLPLAQSDGVLTHWVSRLAHGGKLSISCVDLFEVCRAVHLRTVSVEDANKLLHGEQREPWQFRKANYSLNHLTELIKAKGLRIITKKLVAFEAVVTAERP